MMSHMRVLLIACFLVAFLDGCSNPNESANALFVEAEELFQKSINKELTDPNNTTDPDAFDLSIQAFAKIDEILKFYPSSEVAVKLKEGRVRFCNLSLRTLWTRHVQMNNKTPVYIDCHSDCVILYPGNKKVTLDELNKAHNPVEELFDKIMERREELYLVVIARPHSVKFFRTIQCLVKSRLFDVCYDILDDDIELLPYLVPPKSLPFRPSVFDGQWW